MTRKNAAVAVLKNFDIVDIRSYSSVSDAGTLNKFPFNLFRSELFEAKLLLSMKSTLPDDSDALDSVVLTQILHFCSVLNKKDEPEDVAIGSEIRFRYPSEKLFGATACDACMDAANNTKYSVECMHNPLIMVAGGNLTGRTFVRRHVVLAAESILLIDRAISEIRSGNSEKSIELALAIKDVLGFAQDVFSSSNQSESQRVKQMLSEEKKMQGAKGGAAAAAKFRPLKEIVKRINDERVLAGDPFPSGRQLAIAALDEVLAEVDKRGIGMSKGDPLKRVDVWAREIWEKSH